MKFNGPSIEMEEDVGPSKLPFRTRLADHWKKRWWVHLLSTIVITLVITFPLVYVGYPRIAQSQVNASTLEVTSMVITDPSPKGFYLQQTQVIGSGSIFHPTLFAFDAEIRFTGGGDTLPMLTVSVPDQKAKNGQVVEIEQQVILQDIDAFTEYNKAMVLNKEVTMNIYGKPKLKQGGLPTITVTFNKTVTMKGFDNLSGFKVLEMHLDPDRDDGWNANGTVLIPNPSVVTLAMGNVTFDLSSGGTKLGQTLLRDLVLRPGDNTVPMLSKVDQLALLKLMPEKPPYIVPVESVGNSSVYDGQTISYFTKALAANTIKFELNVSEALPT